jgi:hypothetical protein
MEIDELERAVRKTLRRIQKRDGVKVFKEVSGMAARRSRFDDRGLTVSRIDLEKALD